MYPPIDGYACHQQTGYSNNADDGDLYSIIHTLIHNHIILFFIKTPNPTLISALAYSPQW